MSVTADIYKQASADFESRFDEIAERIIKRGEDKGQIARSLGWGARMLQRWWKENSHRQGKK